MNLFSARDLMRGCTPPGPDSSPFHHLETCPAISWGLAFPILFPILCRVWYGWIPLLSIVAVFLSTIDHFSNLWLRPEFGFYKIAGPPPWSYKPSFLFEFCAVVLIYTIICHIIVASCFWVAKGCKMDELRRSLRTLRFWPTFEPYRD